MAKTDRFMIAPINTGLQSDLKPWLIPDDAFQSLNNAYVFRGRVRKRFGSYVMNQSVDPSVAQLYSRTSILLGQTDVSGDYAGTVPGAVFQVGQLFSVGDQMFTVVVAGTPGAMLSTGSATGTYNTSTGAVSIVGADALTNVYFYPATPIIGLITYEDDTLDNEPVIAFDTQFAYQYLSGYWQRMTGGGAASIWTGSDSQLMWGYTWRGIDNFNSYLFVTNFHAPDLLRYYDGTNWNFLSPVLNGTNTLITARLIVPFKDRLIALNVIENNSGLAPIGTTDGSGDLGATTVPGSDFTAPQYFLVGTTLFTTVTGTPGNMIVSAINTTGNLSAPVATGTFNTTTGEVIITGNNTNINTPVYYLPGGATGTNEAYVNRCRFSQNGSPVAANGWLDSVAGLGGYIDAPTKEQIITCEFLKDRLIVYFESSTWELVYTGNEILPFRWQQINTELGCQSTFSVVPFDKVAIGIGNVGIHACNGSNVERIDDKIPDDVFKISTENDGVYRVVGIRDYYTELTYWSFPSVAFNDNFPNRILVYNYKNGSWAFNDDTITAFGYWQDQSGLTWEATQLLWEQDISTWQSATQSKNFNQIIAGNQEGFIFVIDTESTRNASALQITNIQAGIGDLVLLTVINHNLNNATSTNDPSGGDYILIENAQGVSGLNGNIYEVYAKVDSDTFFILAPGFSGTYTGGGTIATVSQLEIVTKQYNFYVNQGRNSSINKVDFLVDKTQNGQVTVNYSVSSSSEGMLEGGTTTGAILGKSILETSPYALVPLENTQTRLWHPIYPMANGECIQLNIYLSDNVDINLSQIRNPAIAFSDFTLNAMTFYTTPTSSRLQ